MIGLWRHVELRSCAFDREETEAMTIKSSRPRRGSPEATGANSFPITREPNSPYIIADTVAATRSPTGHMEISFLSFRNRFTSQQFTESLSSADPKSSLAEFQISGVQNMLSIEEIGVLRVSNELALQLIEIIVKQLLNYHDLDNDRVIEVLQNSGLNIK